MNITFKTDTTDINWQQVADVLRNAHLCDHTADEQKLAFENSYAVVFTYDGDKIVGVSRALSDGLSQAIIYNIALDEEYRGYGIGRQMIERLIDQLKGQTVILYTHPKNIGLYEKLGFRRNKTAMCIFAGDPDHLKWQERQGFFLPPEYRFEDEIGREDMIYHKPVH